MSAPLRIIDEPLYCWSRNAKGWTISASDDNGITWRFVRCVKDSEVPVSRRGIDYFTTTEGYGSDLDEALAALDGDER